MHNIIVEDEKDTYESLSYFIYDDGININDVPTLEMSHRPISDYATILQRKAEIRDKNIHRNLWAYLIEHLWSKFKNHFK